MNVVDCCGWLEYVAASPNADFFAPALEAPEDLVVPTNSVNEVFQRVVQQRGERRREVDRLAVRVASAPGEPPVHLVVVAPADGDDAEHIVADVEDDAVLADGHAGVLVAPQALGVRRTRVGHQHDDTASDLPELPGG